MRPILPYINLKTTREDFPFLIDTGANINLINPKLAWAYQASKPYDFEADDITSANGKFNATSAIDINFFYPKIDYVANLLHKFHPFFYGIIGTGILNALNANINFSNKTLTLYSNNQRLVIPLCEYSQTNRSSNSIFRTAHLSDEEQIQLKSVLDGSKEVFHEPNEKLTCSTNVECTINTTDDIPVHQKVYPYPAAYAGEVRKQIDKLLEDGIIRPSRSAWTAPVWIVPKKTMLREKRNSEWSLTIGYK